jgi:hypothetical protein
MQLPPLPNLAAAARTWAVESQQLSRRNAMLAAIECSQRRVEREDVDDYLAARTAPAQRSADTAGRDAQR